MKLGRTLALAATLLAATGSVSVWAEPPKPAAADLKPVSAFQSIADQTQRSIALFTEAGKVITHPRCVNCHPVGDHPLQGEDSQPHQPRVVRGPDGFGATAMRCTTCHGQKNFDAGGVPGSPAWHLAPAEMAWHTKALGDICQQIKDPARNGGKSMAEIVTHMAEDPLVGWGWGPHAGREPAPGTQAGFADLIREWVATGAACPAT